MTHPTVTEEQRMQIDLDALQKLCDEATPGPWRVGISDDVDYPYVLSHSGKNILPNFEETDEQRSNAAFIAGFNPVTASALIAKCREQEEEIEDLRYAPWPKWAEHILDRLKEFGFDYDPGEEVNLAEEFDEFVNGYDDAVTRQNEELKEQIAAANERVRELTTLLDQKLGTPCEQIRQQQDMEDRIARAICQETCAFKGEMPCWKMEGDFPPSACDEPGCLYLARATISALATKEQS